MNDTEIDDLRDRLCGGDLEALRVVYERLHAPLTGYVVRMVRDASLAGDLVHDSFVALWNARDRLDSGVSLVPYLYRIARNRALRQVRDSRLHDEKHVLLAMDADHRVFEDGGFMDAEEERERLVLWIQDLPPRQCEALSLSRFHELTHREIADVMDVSVRTVNNHIVRAVETLVRRARTVRMA